MAVARSRTRLLLWWLAALLGLVALLVAVALWQVHRSVPTLDGDARVGGLQAPVTVARDANGTAVLTGATRLDVARALGFVHAQERFFEMDLARRSAAGELAELFGPLALERDQQRRVHRMRAMLTARYATLGVHERALLQAYADGVNAGLAQLGARPWQYLLLRAEPRAWTPVDSLLVIGEMFWMLQGNGVDDALERAQWNACVPAPLARWLEPEGGAWDGALDGSQGAGAVAPGPELIDLRATPPASLAPSTAQRAPAPVSLRDDDRREAVVGSNNWAVDAAHSVTGDAMLANDMHLSLGVPSIWFRAQFEIGAGAGALRAAGVTLPGVPALVIGSNGEVAWGLTNSYGAWFEWGQVGDRTLRVDETIHVKGAADVVLPVTTFDGMPVIADHGRHALNWVADQGAAYNLRLDAMLAATDVDQALRVAASAGMPQLNVVVADRHGRIGWTISGVRFLDPQDSGVAPRLGLQPQRRLAIPPAASAPLSPWVKDPASGLLWTANARSYQAGGVPDGHADLRTPIGDGGFDLGARARQIGERLHASPKFDEPSLGAIQFDDEALFLRPWAVRIAQVSTSRAEVTPLLQHWNGHADADQAAYRLVRETRRRTLDALWKAWSTPLIAAGHCARSDFDWHARFEYAAAQALDQRPAHLLPRGFANWDAFLLAQVDATVDDMTRHATRPLSAATWGERNLSRIGHPLARAVPLLARWLDMPTLPQSGDANMPHVAAPAFGQSERLVVAPGHEERATLTMPGGQSGHPMSPYYGAGHADWAAGRPQPLLAGPAQHVLTLTP